LRERPEDIPVLTDYLIKKYAGNIGRHVAGVSAEVRQKLKFYAFPGNVRELENEVRRMVSMTENGAIITVNQLSSEIANCRPQPHSPLNNALPRALLEHVGMTLKTTVELVEAQLVHQALQRHHWNQSRAARELGLSRVGLDNKIKRYGIERDSAGSISTNSATNHGR
jgi:two-component system response regulator HupR/HoxA